MTKARGKALSLALAILSTVATACAAQGERATVRVGLVMDGPWVHNETYLPMFLGEIMALTADEFDVVFPPDRTVVADWTLASIQRAIDDFLVDPNVDVVLGMGVIASDDLCRRGPLPKPCLAPFALNTTMQSLPLTEDGTSGVSNLSYTVLSTGLDVEIRRFQEVTDLRRVTFLLSRRFTQAIPRLRERSLAEAQRLGIPADVVEVGDSAQEALSRLGPDTEAAYVSALIHMPEAEFKSLTTGLIARRVSSMSIMGRAEVEQGLLMCLAPEAPFEQIARRTALNLQRILLGEAPADLPVLLHETERLSINLATARAIGLFPRWDILLEADLVDHVDDAERPLSLSKAVKQALQANLSLAAQHRLVSAGAQDVKTALAQLLPQISIGAQGALIDSDRAGAMSGFNAQRTLGTSLGVTQVLFSDDVLTGVDTQRLVQLSREHELEQLRLDVTLDSAQAYLNVLRAETFERIQRDNLKLTRQNLELARTRESIGVSGASEVYRWESQIATSQKSVLEAQSAVKLARIDLNRLRHRPLDEPFVAQEAGLDDPNLSINAGPFPEYLDNTRAVDVFQDLLVREGVTQAPELQALEALIGAQQRVRLNARRAHRLPDVLASAGLNHRLAESGAGADALRGRPDDDTEWTATLSLAFPLYSGGAKRAALTQATEELARLNLVRRSVSEQIEQRIRSAVHVAVTSFRSIQLTRTAADAAGKNLNLVTDAYSRGVLSILDLLDAQNAALVAELSASNAVFDFLFDLMEVQRAVGRFDFLLPRDQQTEWLTRLKQRFESSVLMP